MAEPLAEAYVRVRPETSGFKDELKRGVEDSGAGTLGDKQGHDFGEKFSKAALKDLEGISFGRAGNKGGKSFADEFSNAFGKAGKGIVDGVANIPWAGAIFKPLSQAMSSMPPQAQAAIGVGVAGAIAASASFIGAAFNAALLGGTGLGGIGLGIAGQLHDPAVLDAASRLKADLKSALDFGTRPFAPELLAGLDKLDGVAAKLGPRLRADLAPLAPIATELLDGFIGLGKEALPGIEKGLHDAGPILHELAQDLPGIGKSIKVFFDELDSGSVGAKAGIHDLAQGIELTVVATGALVGNLSKAYGWIHAVGEFVATGNVADLIDQFDHGSGVTGHLAKNAYDLAYAFSKDKAAADPLAGSLGDLNGQLSTLLRSQLSIDQANDKFKTDLLQLAQGLDLQGRSLKDNSLAGLHNREVIEGYIADAQQARDAAIAHAGGVNASKAAVDAANSSYDQAIGKLEAVGVKAGLSKKDLDALAGTYQIDIVEAVHKVDISGLAQNIAPHDVNRFGTKKRASGGPFDAGDTVLLGENGPELVSFGRGGFVTPNNLLPAALGGRPGGAASSAPTTMPTPVVNVQVFIDGEEVNARARVVVQEELAGVAAAVGGWRP